MADAVEAGALLVIRAQDIPRRELRIRRFEHHVARAGVIEPATARGQVHRTELPLAEGIGDAGLEPPLLFLVADLEPVLDDLDPAVHDVFLERGTELEESIVLLL